MTSLVFGLVFVGIAGLWALVQTDVLDLPDVSVAGPVVLVLAGLVGLLSTVRRSARGRRDVAESSDAPSLGGGTSEDEDLERDHGQGPATAVTRTQEGAPRD